MVTIRKGRWVVAAGPVDAPGKVCNKLLLLWCQSDDIEVPSQKFVLQRTDRLSQRAQKALLLRGLNGVHHRDNHFHFAVEKVLVDSPPVLIQTHIDLSSVSFASSTLHVALGL